MKVLRVERAVEPCLEAGFVGYYFYLEKSIDADFVESLATLGVLTFLRTLKKPFFIVHGKNFVVRGQQGDDFCKAGIAGNDRSVLESLCEKLEKLQGGE